MKPSELSNEELAGEVMRTNSAYLSRKEADVLHEAAARLRNSIPKPVVRTSPPTVDEVGDNGKCLCYDGEEWDTFYGLTVRTYWHDQPSGDITHWLPMPPEPTALGLEGRLD